MLSHLDPKGKGSSRHQSIAGSIHDASIVFPIEASPEQTASVLVSLAWFESRFTVDASGDRGASLGLFQVQPEVWRIPRWELLRPETAAVHAAKLVVRSFRECRERPWSERLAWYARSSGCRDVPEGVLRQSRVRVGLADELYRRFLASEPVAEAAR